MPIRQYVSLSGTAFPCYGICVGVALLAIGIWMIYNFKKFKMDGDLQNEILHGFPFMVLTGMFFAFALDALFTGDWRTWFGNGERRIGFTFAGCLFGIVLFIFIFGRFTTCGRMFLMNMFLPIFALAQGIGRIGCFLGGCCYGFPCNFGVSYPPGSYPYSMIGPAKVFPVQLVESGCLFALFGLLLCVPFRFRGVSAWRWNDSFHTRVLPRRRPRDDVWHDGSQSAADSVHCILRRRSPIVETGLRLHQR